MIFFRIVIEKLSQTKINVRRDSLWGIYSFWRWNILRLKATPHFRLSFSTFFFSLNHWYSEANVGFPHQGTKCCAIYFSFIHIQNPFIMTKGKFLGKFFIPVDNTNDHVLHEKSIIFISAGSGLCHLNKKLWHNQLGLYFVCRKWKTPD